MATFESYTPTTLITRAMFNFDAEGESNYVLTGPIRVAVSDDFTAADQAAEGFYPDIYTSGNAEVNWSTPQAQDPTKTMADGVADTLAIIAQFANINFQWQGDIDTIGNNTVVNPAEVAAANRADIDISLISRSDIDWVGMSGGSTDESLGYAGSAGDVFINSRYLNDTSFGLSSDARTTLMHELLHSLGLSHPHSAYNNGVPTITADYAATQTLGFSKLGFHITSAMDMYKEYFTIMSYDDGNAFEEAHTPMILDVIALQQAYGPGPGTQTAGDDTITAGNLGYRVYFDTGGIDTIDLSLYSTGAYLHMGTSIVGADHLVGVAMSMSDFAKLALPNGSPGNLRWFYGEYENATGSSAADRLVGNVLDNHISGLAGNDTIYGATGNDTLDGGAGNDFLSGGLGNDRLIGGAGIDTADYMAASSGVTVNLTVTTAQVTGGAGTDTLSGIENLNGSIYADHLTGNGLTNVLNGGNGNDVLNGGVGNDTLNGGGGADKLTGGAGKDIFLFDRAAFGGVDQILDFSSVDDTIKLDHTLFSKLTTGALHAANFREDTTGTALDANDFLVYNTHSGGLLYDADGSGAGKAVQFATLYDGHGGHPTASHLTPLDFVIV